MDIFRAALLPGWATEIGVILLLKGSLLLCAAGMLARVCRGGTAATLAVQALQQLTGGGDGDCSAELAVAHAAAMGGCARGADTPAASQRLGHALAASGKISAAQAAAVVLSYALEYRHLEVNLRLDVLLELMGGTDRFARTPEHQRASAALFVLRNLLNQLFETSSGQICRTLKDAGLTLQEVITIAKEEPVEGEGATQADDEVILTHAWEGRPLR